MVRYYLLPKQDCGKSPISVKATQLSEQIEIDHPVERLTWMGSLELEEEDALWLRVSI